VSRWYDRYFVRKLLEQFAGQQFPAAAIAEILQHRPRTLAEFDDRFTAPLSGFAGVDEYYRTQASGPLLGRITVPTLIIASTDDPVVPASNFSAWPCSRAVRLELQSSGGHLGFLARSLNNGKLRWMDRRLLAWIDG
jgi:predicted alpha/beta-fold hydrolase